MKTWKKFLEDIDAVNKAMNTPEKERRSKATKCDLCDSPIKEGGYMETGLCKICAKAQYGDE